MDKNSRRWNKVFLLGMFGMVFAFGIPASFIFADEIPVYSNGILFRYDYTDWETFYKRCNQYAGQYRYYTIQIGASESAAHDNRHQNSLSRFDTTRFTYINGMGAMVTMCFFNKSKRERIQFLQELGYGGEEFIEGESEFTDYNEALRFWKNAVELLR